MNRFMQTLLALSGLIISGLLGYQTVDSQRQQAEQEKVALFTQQVNFAMTVCDEKLLTLPADILPEMEANKLYEEYLITATQRIEACKMGETIVAVAPSPSPAPTPSTPTSPGVTAPEKSPTIVPPRDVSSPKEETKDTGAGRAPPRLDPKILSQSRNIELRTSEGLRSIKVAPAGATWHAVLASYRPEEAKAAYEHYRELTAIVQKKTSEKKDDTTVAIYRTRISNHLAIVVDPGGTREQAQSWVDMARREGWSRDAFVQDNRKWTKCDDPRAAPNCTSK
jgi:hypothetical protein